ncbi:MAG: aminotransferase class III-fold pyridoxal phosphate-dependent enzyme [Candidatus Eisenbacteria bacterium]|nr:aminotransferase class III-fold pyridoxal phosphate-dependent enzyme [Candidatus Eisenbacteria bacterium]
MTADRTRSQQLYDRALKVMPGGASRNTILRRPHPLYVERGQGARVYDVEGVERIDFANNMASLIHGHAHPAIVSAVGDQLERGTAFTLGTEREIEYAEHLVDRAASFDKIRFVNSGTEAVMACLKASRAFTGRPKIAKAEGAYHGLYDFAEISQTAQPATWGDPCHPASVPVAYGTPQSVLDDVIVIPFNDAEHALARLDEHADEIACVLIDPVPHRVGLIPIEPAFVRTLRDWTERNGSLLVYDEVITFRIAHGGAQEQHGIRPDLTALGKMIGGGFPVGAIAGRREVMDVMDPLAERVLFPHSGTFSANPITMTAGYTAMKLYDREAVERINTLAVRARNQIEDAISVAGITACVTGAGSMLRVHFKPEPPREYRTCYMAPDEAPLLSAFLDYLFDHGIILINTGTVMLSTVMTEREIDTLSEAMLGGFRKVRELSP